MKHPFMFHSTAGEPDIPPGNPPEEPPAETPSEEPFSPDDIPGDPNEAPYSPPPEAPPDMPQEYQYSFNLIITGSVSLSAFLARHASPAMAQPLAKGVTPSRGADKLTRRALPCCPAAALPCLTRASHCLRTAPCCETAGER